MPSNNAVEHFVTLFDSKFLPIGLCLHASLMRHAQPFRLWVLCMDELVEKQLSELSLPHVSLIPLSSVETAELLAVKEGRTAGEYCWTLTPFTPQFVFERDPSVQRVTYLDTDLFFFDSPHILLDEFEGSGKHVLITEHAYAPEYDVSPDCGKFCVQFITVRNSQEGHSVMQWWQDRCLEWCFARIEDGKFGDQKYLDIWPELFANEVHVLKQIQKTLAPWNVNFFSKTSPAPVFYHFQGLKIISPRKVLLYAGYRVGKGKSLYQSYYAVLKEVVEKMRAIGMPIPTLPINSEKFHKVRSLIRIALGIAKYAEI